MRDLPRMLRRGRIATLTLPLLCCSCSMLLVDTIPTKPGAALRPRAPRQELIASLGNPRATMAVPISDSARLLCTNEPAVFCDIYRVSGLVQIDDDPYTGDWKDYPAFAVIMLGVPELFEFPYVTVDLSLRSLRRYDLEVWYSASGELIAYERHKP